MANGKSIVLDLITLAHVNAMAFNSTRCSWTSILWKILSCKMGKAHAFLCTLGEKEPRWKRASGLEIAEDQ